MFNLSEGKNNQVQHDQNESARRRAIVTDSNDNDELTTLVKPGSLKN